MSHRILALCIMICLLLAGSYGAFAEEFDQFQRGAISVTLTDQQQNEPIVGAELSVYYVAAVVMDADGDLLYDYVEEFKQLDVAVDDDSLVAKLDAFVSQHSVPSVKMLTNEQGTARCDELSLGLYFVKQIGKVEGFTPCVPFLVTVPYEQDGEYVYEVNASPKTEVERLVSVTVKKVWNTNASHKAAQHVTVQLLKNGNVVKTASLGEDNNWQVTFADMPISDAYSVKEVDIPKGFTATYKQDEYTFTVTNTANLAQTGQLLWPIPVLAACGMLLIAVGIVLLQKKRTTHA